jgi:hypothetical protein
VAQFLGGVHRTEVELRLSLRPDMAAQGDGSRGIDGPGDAVGRRQERRRRGKGDDTAPLNQTHLDQPPSIESD